MTMAEKINLLQGLYQQIETQITDLKQNSCLSCVRGCGECCKRFEPYISVLEAAPIAEYLVQNPTIQEKFHDRVEKNKENWQHCPFYDPDNDLHCTIYTIRPLICRMFGFSMNAKNGKREFSTCKLIQQEMPAQVKVAQRLSEAGLSIPVYQEVFEQVRAIDFDLATDYHPFSRSVEIALALRQQKERTDISTPEDANKNLPEKKLSVPFSVLLRQKLQRSGGI